MKKDSALRTLAALGTTALLSALLQAPPPALADDVTVAPIMSGPYSGSDPIGVAVDASGGRWIKANGHVRYFPRGSTTASRDITGANADIDSTAALAVDAHGALYAPSATVIKVFAPGANGNVAPFRTISGANTGLSGVSGIDVDADGYIYVTDATSSSLSVFAPSATGNAFPISRIIGGRTQLSGPADVRRYGADVWVASTGSDALLAFAVTDDGNVAPRRVIGGYRTRLDGPAGIDVDNGGNIYVATPGFVEDQVLVFAPGATGNAAPARVVTVSGRNYGPNEIAVDSRRQVHLANIYWGSTDTLAALRTVLPGAPRSPRVSGLATATTRTVSWLAPAFDGYAPITSYQVQVKAGTTLRFSRVLPGSARAVAVSRAVLGAGARTAYVRARNVSGWSGWAKVAFVVR